MKIPSTFQLNVMSQRNLLHTRINEFLQNNQLHPTRVDDMTVAQLIKAYISDLLMPSGSLSRVVAVCTAEFGVGNGVGWYTTNIEGVHPLFIHATRIFHQEILDATLYDIEHMLFNVIKVPADWVWDIGMGPWGAMIVSPIKPIAQPETAATHRPKILCGAVKQMPGEQYKRIDVRYIPASLEQDDEPNAFILSELDSGSRIVRRRTPQVARPMEIPAHLREVLEDLIKAKNGYVERGRYD